MLAVLGLDGVKCKQPIVYRYCPQGKLHVINYPYYWGILANIRTSSKERRETI